MKILKLIVAGVLLVGSVFLFVEGMVLYGVLGCLLSAMFVLFYFKNEKNLIAFLLVRKSKFQVAENILKSVKHPERMIKTQEAYFYFLSGLVQTQQQKHSAAEKLFKKSLKSGLRTKTDRAVANLNLSGISLSQRNKKLASYYLRECKKLDKQKMLSAQIRELESMMKRA